MVKSIYIPNTKDVVWIDFNPVRGHEQAHIRPALVLSPKAYNQKTGLIIACAITSHIKGYPYEVCINEKKIVGAVLTDQMRTLDWKVRKVKFIQTVSQEIMDEVQDNIRTLLFE